jgi:methyl-accepting chemotaxis protein
MAGTWTFGQRLGAGLAMSVATLVVVAVIGHGTTQKLIENDNAVDHTVEVRRQLAQLLLDVVNLETGYRGFAIAGKEEFLEPFETAVRTVERELGELRALIADNPSQLKRLATAESQVQDKLNHGKAVIAARRTGKVEAANNLIANQEGKRIMDGLRRTVSEMDREEATLLERRRRESQASADEARKGIVWGSFAGVLLVIAVGVYISRSLTRQIGSAVRHIQSSSTELQAAANQQSTGAKEQSTAMSEITTTISELMATAKQIAESARRVSSIAEETSTSAKNGDQMVRRTNDLIATIQRQVDLIVTHMLDLGKKSQQIGGILELINELAEQTNILAINATIEAAGAGESGRRFGVVAEEIRRLADRVGGSTKEIRQLIEDIRSAVNKTVMATEGGNKAVDAGARQFAEVASAFSQIAGMVTTTTEASREIELSTKQQSTAVEQVNVAVSSVAQASREMEASSGQTLQTASELALLSRELLKVVQAQTAS